MTQFIQRQLPPYARLDHPILRHILGVPRGDHARRRTPYVRVFLAALLVALMIAAGVVIGSEFFAVDLLQQPISQALSAVVFWPLLIAQLLLRLTALGMTIGTVSEEQRRQTWDSLRATSNGAALALQARWSAVVFYRLRPALLLMTAARLLLIAALLYDLTAFSGDYLSFLTGDIQPAMSVPVAVLLLTFALTASLLMPLTGTGLDAALGLLVSTFVQRRVYVVLAQITLSALRVAVVIGLLAAVLNFRDDTLLTNGTSTGLWLLIFGFAALGDWGVSLLHLGYFGAEVWANVPYSILIGPALLGFVVVQAALIDGLLWLAVRRADRSE
ncbi:hypothetical protein HC928_20890 [bacterium]|nr:hypothetical protein [bacterium]